MKRTTLMACIMALLTALLSGRGYCQDSTLVQKHKGIGRLQFIPFAGASMTWTSPQKSTFGSGGFGYCTTTNYYPDGNRNGGSFGLTIRPKRRGVQPELSMAYQSIGIAYRCVSTTKVFTAPDTVVSQERRSLDSRFEQLVFTPGFTLWSPRAKGLSIGFGGGFSVCVPLREGHNTYVGPSARLLVGTRRVALRMGATSPMGLVIRATRNPPHHPSLKTTVAEAGLAVFL